MHKVIVRVGRDGQLTVEVNGVKGPDCLLKTEALREALGETVDLTHTEEYHEAPEVESEGPAFEIE